MIKQAQYELIITFGINQTPRILQEIQNTPDLDSSIFDDITPYSLSGLFVGLFLIIMLSIAISCLYDLKTNDRFARQNLWVGRES